MFRRDGWRCVQCGKAGRLECDHVTALQREQGQDPYDLERLTGALLDRITHHVHILEMNARATGSSRAGHDAGNRPNNPPLVPVGPQAPPTRGPPPAAPTARRPARGSLPWTTRTSYHRARGTFLRRRAGTYSRRR